MNRSRRTRILVEGSPRLARKLADEIRTAYEVQPVQAAHHGLVMAKVRESARSTLFYLDDVLVAGAIHKLLDLRWWDWPHELIRERLEAFSGPVDAFLEAYGHG